MLNFDYTIPTSLSPAHVWHLLTQSLIDSSQSMLWPDDLETIQSDVSLGKGSVLHSTYKLGPLRSHHTYRLTTFDRASRELVYRTRPGHPLVGGGHITLRPYGESGCKIHWRGAYARKLSFTSLGAAWFTEYYFEKKFFAALKHNLRRIEDATLAVSSMNASADEAGSASSTREGMRAS